mmetsp:Transcript_44240/g.134070  ORF Transcript_44240/g.134070 Transcript_44240/m.134070 type:complete len:228 (+) Transcript_44240:29-712(+)
MDFGSRSRRAARDRDILLRARLPAQGRGVQHEIVRKLALGRQAGGPLARRPEVGRRPPLAAQALEGARLREPPRRRRRPQGRGVPRLLRPDARQDPRELRQLARPAPSRRSLRRAIGPGVVGNIPRLAPAHRPHHGPADPTGPRRRVAPVVGAPGRERPRSRVGDPLLLERDPPVPRLHRGAVPLGRRPPGPPPGSALQVDDRLGRRLEASARGALRGGASPVRFIR